MARSQLLDSRKRMSRIQKLASLALLTSTLFLSACGSGGGGTVSSTSGGKIWTVSTLAGTTGTPGSANGTGTAATFQNPSGVALDSAGNMYVADYNNHLIRKIQ